MKRTTTLPTMLTPAEAEAIVDGFLTERRAKHGDATMTAPLGGDDGAGGGDDGTDPGAGGATDTGSTGRPAPSNPSDPNYFPPHTAVAEMSAPQQAAYHRYQRQVSQDHQRELERELAALRPKAAEYDELVAATRSEGEVAIDEALEIGREEGAVGVRMEVAAEFLREQLSPGRTPAQVDALMRGLSPAGFLSEDGSKIDYQSIRAFVANLGGGTGTTVDIGQGRRGGQSKPSVAGGRDLYEQTHPPKKTASA